MGDRSEASEHLPAAKKAKGSAFGSFVVKDKQKTETQASDTERKPDGANDEPNSAATAPKVDAVTEPVAAEHAQQSADAGDTKDERAQSKSDAPGEQGKDQQHNTSNALAGAADSGAGLSASLNVDKLQMHQMHATSEVLRDLGLSVAAEDRLVCAILQDVDAWGTSQPDPPPPAPSSVKSKRRQGSHSIVSCQDKKCIVCELWPNLEAGSAEDKDRYTSEMMKVAKNVLSSEADREQRLVEIQSPVEYVAEELAKKSPSSAVKRLGMCWTDGWHEGRLTKRYTVSEAACFFRHTGMAALLLQTDGGCVMASMKGAQSKSDPQVGMHILRGLKALPIERAHLRDAPKNNHAHAVAALLFQK